MRQRPPMLLPMPLMQPIMRASRGLLPVKTLMQSALGRLTSYLMSCGILYNALNCSRIEITRASR